jgi:hypothetical protein
MIKYFDLHRLSSFSWMMVKSQVLSSFLDGLDNHVIVNRAATVGTQRTLLIRLLLSSSSFQPQSNFDLDQDSGYLQWTAASLLIKMNSSRKPHYIIGLLWLCVPLHACSYVLHLFPNAASLIYIYSSIFLSSNTPHPILSLACRV